MEKAAKTRHSEDSCFTGPLQSTLLTRRAVVMSQAVVFKMNFALLIHAVVTGNTGTDAYKQSPLRLSLCIPCFNVREYIHKGFCAEISK